MQQVRGNAASRPLRASKIALDVHTASYVMDDDRMLTIGDFARLGHVSPRMLRHDDDVGLLSPDSVEPATDRERPDRNVTELQMAIFG